MKIPIAARCTSLRSSEKSTYLGETFKVLKIIPYTTLAKVPKISKCQKAILKEIPAAAFVAVPVCQQPVTSGHGKGERGDDT